MSQQTKSSGRRTAYSTGFMKTSPKQQMTGKTKQDKGRLVTNEIKVSMKELDKL